MRHPMILMLALVIAVAMAASGCIIKNAEGKDIFRFEFGGKKNAQEPAVQTSGQENPDKEKAEADKSLKEAGAKVDEAKKETAKAPEAKPADKAKPAPAQAEDNSDAPWWVKPRKDAGNIKQKNLDEEKPAAGAENKPSAESTPPPSSPDAGATPSPKDETAPTEGDNTQSPVRRTVQVDRHLNQIPSSLWNDTYKQQTSKKSSPARRASMEQVKQGIEAGYGTTYVTKMEKAISLERNNGYAYYFLARGRFEKGDWKRSQSFAESAISKLSNDLKFRAAARVVMSKCLANQGNLEDAEKQANEAAADDPDNTEAKILVLRFTKQ